MGLLERSKSLRRKQSTTDISKAQTEEGLRIWPNTSAPAMPAYNPARQHREGDPVLRISPVTAKLSRNNPLPTPDKDPFYHPNSSSQTIEISAELQTYRFPTPSPRSLPRASPIQPFRDPSTIGVALGSPRLQLPQPHQRGSPGYPSPLRTYSEPALPPNPDPPKLRKSRSKSFRNVFSSKPPPPPAKPAASQSPVAPVQMPMDIGYRHGGSTAAVQGPKKANASPNPAYILSSAPEQATRNFTRQARRAEIDRQHIETRREVIRHAKTESGASSGPKPAPAPIQIKPAPYPAKKANYTEIKIPDMYSALSPSAESGAPPRPQPHLNVVIPKTEMERYSVMFEKLLKPPPPSLAERRGTTSRLRPLREEAPTPTLAPIVAPRRRATSPAIMSPDIVQKSIDEATRHHKEAAERLMKMRRSNTAPLESAQPPPVPRKPSIGNLARRETTSPLSPLWSEASLPLTPNSTTQTIFSTSENDHHEDKGLFTALRDSSSSNQSGRSDAPPRMDSLTGMEQLPPKQQFSAEQQVPRAAVREVDPYAYDTSVRTGHVKVARSISVNKPGKHVPVAVKQPMRPRVVDLHHVGSERKSTMVLIEQA